MHRIFTYTWILFIPLLLLMRIYAQEWQRLYPFPEVINNTLYSVDFVDENFGWAVGQWGIIMHTIDGGQNWEIQQNHTQHWDLLSVDFVDRQIGWAVGEYGTILYTNDGGVTWTNQDVSDLYYFYYDVQFLDEKSGWILPRYGSFILKTIDGGAHWDSVKISYMDLLNPSYKSLSLLDETKAWIVGYDQGGLIIHTNDGGDTWDRQESGVDYDLTDVEFSDSLNGWVCGSKTLRTENGGLTWQIVTDDPWKKLSSLSPQLCWILHTNYGIIKKTTDGGKNWQEQETDPYSRFKEILFINENEGWCVGSDGVIIHTTDGGNSRTLQHETVPDYILDGIFSSNETGWITASRFDQMMRPLYRTTDGGYTWIVHLEGEYTFYDVPVFCDSQNGWVSGKENNIPFLRRTRDGGDTWQDIAMPEEMVLKKFSFVNPQTGYATGERRKYLFKTTNGGDNWELIFENTDFGDLEIYNLFFADEDHGWMVTMSRDTDTGEILRTDDGGRTWEAEIINVVMAVDFINAEYGMLAGFSPFGPGIVNITHDGGLNWERNELNAPWLHDIDLITKETIWIAGDFGFIAQSTDSGKTWQEYYTKTHAYLNTICFPENGQVGYVFGNDDVLYKYDARPKSLPSNEDVEIPKNFDLLTNYPNPFNTTTIICFTITKPAQVILTIYDVLGRKIKNLTDKYYTAGRYMISWNGTNERGKKVPSGIYILSYHTQFVKKSIKICLLK